jgi:hypothetical protein
MRDLNKEAALWYFFTSPELYEKAAQECEKTMKWFGNVAIAHGVVNFGRNNQVYDAFKNAAANFRKGAEFARMGDYTVARNAASGIDSNIRGMIEQPFHSWMTPSEYQEFESNQISNILAYVNIIEHAMANAFSGADSFLDSQLNPDIKNRDDGFPDEEVIDWFKKYTDLQYYSLGWILPDPLPHYRIDTSISCKTGDEVPWTGVWYPETGLERHSLTFAIKGLRMQPVYFAEKTLAEAKAEDDIFGSPVTKAIATTWHPLIPVPQSAHAEGELRVTAGKPCPKAGLWESMDGKHVSRKYQVGDIMADLGSAYGLTVWKWIQS